MGSTLGEPRGFFLEGFTAPMLKVPPGMRTKMMPVRSVIAQHPNPKITTAEDLVLVRALVGADR